MLPTGQIQQKFNGTFTRALLTVLVISFGCNHARPLSSAVLTVFGVGVASMCVPGEAHGQMITLTEAVRTAESHDRSIHIAQLEREKARQ